MNINITIPYIVLYIVGGWLLCGLFVAVYERIKGRDRKYSPLGKITVKEMIVCTMFGLFTLILFIIIQISNRRITNKTRRN